jgi:hypothetical protein
VKVEFVEVIALLKSSIDILKTYVEGFGGGFGGVEKRYIADCAPCVIFAAGVCGYADNGRGKLTGCGYPMGRYKGGLRPIGHISHLMSLIPTSYGQFE